ncbi:MAG: hypothetical protein ABR905_15305 [Terracidiphilus sp.]|jgi:hypothetical protein
MSQSTRGAVVTRSILIARLVGICIYVWAFFLPAVREIATPGGDAPEMLKGSRCAWITLINTLNPEMWHSKYFLTVFSGWINPLLVLYLIFLLFPIFRWPRRIAAGLIVAFMTGTWVFFAMYPLVPLVGHFLWIAGILLILAGEVFASRKADLAAE